MLYVERLYPYILALITSYTWWKLGLAFPRDEKEFLAAALSFGAVVAGFMATAQAILMALPGDSVMKQLKSSGYINELIEYIAAAIYGSMAFCVTNVVGFFLIAENGRLHLFYSTAWIFFMTLTILAFFRVASIMLKVMRH